MTGNPLLDRGLDPRRTAFFLDFDGTLAEIVEDPAAAAPTPRALAMLDRLMRAADGALAIVSGRSIAQLDAMLHPLRPALAGVHGLERRSGDGTVHPGAVDADAHAGLAAAVEAFVDGREGLLAEAKPGSVALHFRRRPELERECRAFAARLAGADPRIALVEGKKVIEMKLGDRTKADAVAAFLAEPPFAGRLPFFAGDDATDETAFALVNARGGVTIKVGDGDTQACGRIANPRALVGALEHLLERE